MTEIGWYSDPDLLEKLVVPADFPRDEYGLPDPHPLGLSYRELVRRYSPEEIKSPSSEEVAPPKGNQRLGGIPKPGLVWPH